MYAGSTCPIIKKSDNSILPPNVFSVLCWLYLVVDMAHLSDSAHLVLVDLANSSSHREILRPTLMETLIESLTLQGLARYHRLHSTLLATFYSDSCESRSTHWPDPADDGLWGVLSPWKELRTC